MKHKKNFYLSTPLYYASGKPHIGHAYTTILGDVICKYKKLLGCDCFFLTGMDEHGQKISQYAQKMSISEQEFVNQISNDFKNLWKKLNIDYSVFVRTTNLNHIKTVQSVFETLVRNKDIYQGHWKGLYCVSCEENYTINTSKRIDDKLYCNLGHELVQKNEESYFFRISKYQNWLIDFLKKDPNFLYPKTRLNELMNSFINHGLEDVSVSRTSFDWGVPILANKKHIVYVWIDALLGYLTGLSYGDSNDFLYQKYWNNNETEIVHLMSKEITRFHCIYWPIILKTLEIKEPSKVISHGWITTKEGKMSKSLGNVIDPNYYIDLYGSDALRYCLIKNISIEHDSMFTNEIFVNTFNNDLANNFGNLISRTIGMAKKYCNGSIKLTSIILNDHSAVFKKITSCEKNFHNLINDFKINELLIDILNLANEINKFIQDVKPWELNAQKSFQTLESFLLTIVKSISIINYYLSPILTEKTKEIAKLFNFENASDFFEFKKDKIHFESNPIIFKRIEK